MHNFLICFNEGNCSKLGQAAKLPCLVKGTWVTKSSCASLSTSLLLLLISPHISGGFGLVAVSGRAAVAGPAVGSPLFPKLFQFHDVYARVLLFFRRLCQVRYRRTFLVID